MESFCHSCQEFPLIYMDARYYHRQQGCSHPNCVLLCTCIITITKLLVQMMSDFHSFLNQIFSIIFYLFLYLSLGDDSSIIQTNRGGPEEMMTTSWIQIVSITPRRQGTYYCIAKNTEGMSQSYAFLSVYSDTKTKLVNN